MDWYTTENITSCSGVICMNGKDAGSCQFKCSCEVNVTTMFHGNHCEHILFNEDIIKISTSARTANFTWPGPPNISVERYKFVYWKEDYATIFVDDFYMITATTSRLADLDSGKVTYRVCVLSSTVTDSENIDIELHFNNDTCLSIETQESEIDKAFTVALTMTGVFLIACVIMMIALKLMLDGVLNHEECNMKQGYAKVNDTMVNQKQPKRKKHVMQEETNLTGYANENSVNDRNDGNRIGQSFTSGFKVREDDRTESMKKHQLMFDRL